MSKPFVIDCSSISEAVLEEARTFNREVLDASVARPAPRGMDEVGAFLDIPVNLALIPAEGLPVPWEGVKLIMMRANSEPGAQLIFRSAGRVELFYPGCRLEAPFKGGTLLLGPGSANTGFVYFKVVKLEGYDFREPVAGGPMGIGNAAGTGIGPSGAVTQAYNSAAGNIPVLTTDGLSLAGVRGARAQVIAPAGQTIAGGEIHWWQLDTVTGVWGETAFTQVYGLATNNRIWFPGDLENWVQEGRLYPEWRSGTHSGGSGAFTVRMYTSGG